MSANRKGAGNEYYYIDQSRPVSLWRVLLDILLVLLTVGLSAGLVMAYLSTGISPERVWIFAFFGLGAPFLFLGNFVMLLVWIIRWRWWALIPLLTLLGGLGYLGTLVQVDFRKEYHADVDPGAVAERRKDPEQIAVMTYNIHGFNREQNEHSGYIAILDSVGAYVERMQPDVVCFQEYETMMPADVHRVDSLFRKWPYRALNFIYGGNGDVGYGTAIFSRFPILASERLRFEHSANSMLWADLLTPSGDTLRLFNNHLQSTQVDESSQDRVERLEVSGQDGAERFVRSLGSRLKANYRRRAVQVDTVSQIIAQSPYPVVVVGDFNDTPVSYTYKKMRGTLEDPFINVGTGFAYTYNRLFSMLRIDYIFHSPAFESVAYRSDDLPWSDHNPVFVRIRRIPSETDWADPK